MKDFSNFVNDFDDTKSHVIVGPNGSGKSTLLRSIAEESMRNGSNVIAIAPSLYDKFNNLRGQNFSFIGARQGRRLVKQSLIKLLSKVSNDNLILLKNVSNTLEYMGFDGEIGIQIKDLSPIKMINADGEFKNIDESYDAENLLNKWSNRYGDEEIAWLHMKDFSFDEINKSIFSRIAKYENVLKRAGVISSVEYYLRRKNEVIPILEASSGELTLIFSIISICTHINDKSVILIDEPETSLHPIWQKEYFSRIMDLFHYWGPRIIIATHSPIVVSGIESDKDSNLIKIHELGKLDKSKDVSERESIEKIMWERFETLTPHNNYLSERSVQLLNDLSGKRISFEEYERELVNYKNKSYDKMQVIAINNLIELGKKVLKKTE